MTAGGVAADRDAGDGHAAVVVVRPPPPPPVAELPLIVGWVSISFSVAASWRCRRPGPRSSR